MYRTSRQNVGQIRLLVTITIEILTSNYPSCSSNQSGYEIIDK